MLGAWKDFLMGKLVLLGLPIGNLEDLSKRAREKLTDGVYFLAEDTRNLVKILGLLGIDSKSKVISSFHEHKQSQVEKIINKIVSSKTEYILVSDAGSPVLSDPGFPLVKEAIQQQLQVENIPGPTSAMAALDLSGLPPVPFHFWGFLPKQEKQLKVCLDRYSKLEGTHIFFESPHRIEKTLTVLKEEYPNSLISLSRELTKKFEHTYQFEAKDFSTDLIKTKGEFVLLINYADSLKSSEPINNDEVVKLALDILDNGARPKALAKLLAKILDKDVNNIYSSLTKN